MSSKETDYPEHVDYLYKHLGRLSTSIGGKLWDISRYGDNYCASFRNESGGTSEYPRKSWFDLKTFLNSVLD